MQQDFSVRFEDQISGPSLPPDFKCKNDSSSSDSDSDSSDSGDEKSGSKQIGPEMPSGLRKRSSEADSEVYGPVIPNKKQKTEQNQSASVGPILPPGFKPSYKPSSDSESEDDIIGPRPPGMGVVQLSAAEEFEKRAERMKKKLLGQDMPEVKTRETWMTELPDSLGSSLLGMPVAKSRFGDGKKTKIDRAGWTETPQDREKRQMEGKSQFEEADQEEEFNFSVPSARDKEMEAAVEELNSKRQDSLLDLHRNKLSKKSKKKDKKEKKEKKDKKEKKEKKDKKKKKKKEKDKKSKKDKKEKKEKPAERRPFDRDMDLKANHFDNAKKNALIKRSQQLNTRFQSSGQTGQFL